MSCPYELEFGKKGIRFTTGQLVSDVVSNVFSLWDGWVSTCFSFIFEFIPSWSTQNKKQTVIVIALQYIFSTFNGNRVQFHSSVRVGRQLDPPLLVPGTVFESRGETDRPTTAQPQHCAKANHGHMASFRGSLPHFSHFTASLVWLWKMIQVDPSLQ